MNNKQVGMLPYHCINPVLKLKLPTILVHQPDQLSGSIDA